jgi:hypothetical protein
VLLPVARRSRSNTRYPQHGDILVGWPSAAPAIRDDVPGNIARLHWRALAFPCGHASPHTGARCSRWRRLINRHAIMDNTVTCDRLAFCRQAGDNQLRIRPFRLIDSSGTGTDWFVSASGLVSKSSVVRLWKGDTAVSRTRVCVVRDRRGRLKPAAFGGSWIDRVRKTKRSSEIPRGSSL